MGGVPSPEVSYSGFPSGSTVMQQSVRRGILKLDPGQLIIRHTHGHPATAGALSLRCSECKGSICPSDQRNWVIQK